MTPFWCGKHTVYAVAMAALISVGGVASAVYPDKPVTIVAQQPPGSGSDAMTRILADCLAKELDQPMIVQNKPGANGILAVNYLKGQARDGYTLMTIGMSQMTITPYVFKKAPYDPHQDFAGITVFAETPMILVASPGSGIKSFSDLTQLSALQDDGINFGSPGNGSPAHLLTTALLSKIDVPGMHIPFVGESAGVTALIGEQINLMTLVSGTALPQVNGGKLVPLALFANERSPAFPDVPTITELLDDDELARPAWIGLVAAEGTDESIVEILNTAAQACINDDAYVQRLAKMNADALAMPSYDLLPRAKNDSDVWRPLIDSLGLAVD